MAIKSQLATLHVRPNGSPNPWGLVSQVTNLPSPAGEANPIDVTHLGSTAREFIAGLKNNGNFAVEGFYDPTDLDGQIEMRTASVDGAARDFKITFSTGGTITFSGIVTNFSVGQAVDQAVTFTSSVQITADAVWS